MSADNYIFVRVREDGKFGVSMRFASCYYSDDGPHTVDPAWIGPPPPDRYGIFDTAEAAVMAAHRFEQEEAIVEYGVCLGGGVA